MILWILDSSIRSLQSLNDNHRNIVLLRLIWSAEATSSTISAAAPQNSKIPDVTTSSVWGSSSYFLQVPPLTKMKQVGWLLNSCGMFLDNRTSISRRESAWINTLVPIQTRVYAMRRTKKRWKTSLVVKPTSTSYFVYCNTGTTSKVWSAKIQTLLSFPDDDGYISLLDDPYFILLWSLKVELVIYLPKLIRLISLVNLDVSHFFSESASKACTTV